VSHIWKGVLVVYRTFGLFRASDSKEAWFNEPVYAESRMDGEEMGEKDWQLLGVVRVERDSQTVAVPGADADVERVFAGR
jgi:hypothetical protein